MVDTILVLTQSKFTQRDFNRFGLPQYFKAGYKVQVFELSLLLQSTHYKVNFQPEDLIIDDYVSVCSTWCEFESQVKAHVASDSIAVNFLSLNENTKPIYQILTICRIAYCQFQISLLPDSRSAFRQFISSSIFYIKNYLLSPGLMPAAAVIYAGANGRKSRDIKCSVATKFISVGSVDYNTYLESVKSISSELSDQKYFVFLDEYYPLHPDLQGQHLIDPEYYYKKVNQFLAEMSKSTGYECIVALHPRASFGTNPFKVKAVVGKTCELTLQAEFAVGHASTSFSFPILGKKPLIQIGFKSLTKNYYGLYLTRFADLLKTSVVFLDTDYTLPDLKVNEISYDKYVHDYIIEDRKQTHTLAADGVISFINHLNTL
jgi:hypothetical protein